MIRKSVLVLLIPFLFCGCESSREKDVHYTMQYADAAQVPVPPEAISPFEPKEVTYVDEPLNELDSDWNLDVKLFSKYRYTNKFVERWRAKMSYTPTRPIMTDEEFFSEINLNYPGLEKVKAAVASADFDKAWEEYLSYQATRARPIHLKPIHVSKEAGEAAIGEADKIMADPKFPACIPGRRFSLFGLLGYLERAYLHTQDIKYASAWLDMFDHWYVTYRPPAHRLKAYICFIYEPYWSTLAARGSASSLCESERWLAHAEELGLDKDKIFNVYKSILEHEQFLYLNNDVFMPANWQVHQCESMIKIGAYFPSFKKSQFWCEHVWKLMQEHIVKETYNDGTHCENSVGYAMGVISANRNVVRIVRKLGWEIPDGFLKKLRSMYLAGTKIITPTNSSVPIGDGGFGRDGYLVRRLLIPGVLEFYDPTMKYFTEQYPDEVKKFAKEQFENTAEVLAVYNGIKAEKPSFTSTLLPDADWAVMRHSWDKESPYMFFDGGWDEAWHSHPDFGTFNIWAYGKPIVTECGRSGPYEADINIRESKGPTGTSTGMIDAPYISLHQEKMAFVQFQVLLLPYEGENAPEIGINCLDADKIDRVHRQNIGYELSVLGRKDVFLESSNPAKLA